MCQTFALQEWTTAPGRDAQLEYRLSIYHAKENDTGSYTCETPFGKHHTIGIIVKEVINMTRGQDSPVHVQISVTL